MPIFTEYNHTRDKIIILLDRQIKVSESKEETAGKEATTGASARITDR